MNTVYMKVYIYMNLIVQGIIPFLILLVLNIIIYIKLVAVKKESRPTRVQFQHAKEVKLVWVNLVIVLGKK